MKTKQLLTGLIIVALALCTTATWAQQKDPRVTQPTPPTQPITTGESSSRTVADGSAEAAAPAPQQTKQPPLTSAEPWSLGSLGGGRSYFVPSFSVSLLGDTNPGLASGGSTIGMVGQFSGRLQLQRIWAQRQLMADYGFGSEFNSQNSDYNATAHSFGLSYSIQTGRWGFLFSDRGAYATQSRGTFAGLGTGLPGTSQMPGNMTGLYSPEQTILTLRAGRITNSVLGEARYQAGRRTILTFTGSYGLVHFLDSGFFDAKTMNFSTGYNYSLNGRDTIGVSYSASLLRFDGTRPGVDSHSVSLNYGRFLTGRMSLQLGGGAQFSNTENPTTGSTTFISWTVSSAMQYQFARSTLSLVYFRGVTAGSGIFAGARTESVQLGAGRQLTRVWNANFGMGYARNERLVTVGAADAINTVFARTLLSRPLGRYSRVGLRYDLQRQIGAGNDIGFRHVFGINFDFRFRPLELE